MQRVSVVQRQRREMLVIARLVDVAKSKVVDYG